MFEYRRIYPKHGRDGHDHDDDARQPPRLVDSIKVSRSPRESGQLNSSGARRSSPASIFQRPPVRRKEDIGSESGHAEGPQRMTNAINALAKAVGDPKGQGQPKASPPVKVLLDSTSLWIREDSPGCQSVRQTAPAELRAASSVLLPFADSVPVKLGTPECGGVVEIRGRQRASAIAGVRDISGLGGGRGRKRQRGYSKSCPAPASTRWGAEM